jgi:hypothetical protein
VEGGNGGDDEASPSMGGREGEGGRGDTWERSLGSGALQRGAIGEDAAFTKGGFAASFRRFGGRKGGYFF